MNCPICNRKLIFITTPNLGAGKLKDGNRVCRFCFKKIIKINPSLGFSLKKKLDTKGIIDLLNQKENIDFTENETLKINLTVHINYTDLDGNESERIITISGISQTFDDDFMLDAFCHKKNEFRNFRLSRVSLMTDIKTGEIINNPVEYILDKYIQKR